ncbi:hypothetical protein HBB04_04201 [Pseudomonas coronafaciens]|nr:hypothetical protein HBB04_04201 [Pseudomonas coronafaciens]
MPQGLDLSVTQMQSQTSQPLPDLRYNSALRFVIIGCCVGLQVFT